MNSKQETILIATHNQGKFLEIKAALDTLSYHFISLADLGISFDVDETGTTFEENALLKARTFCELTGLATLADDSGLEVDALNGEPGIYSARYAGNHATAEEKVAFLLSKADHIPDNQRQAHFKTVLALWWPSGLTQTYEGRLSGMLLRAPRGPILPSLPYCAILYLEDYKKTVAELKTEKNLASPQRTQALEKLIADLDRKAQASGEQDIRPR